MKLINFKKKNITFDIKDIESLAKSFCNLERIEILDCKLNDEIVYTLLSNLQYLSKESLDILGIFRFFFKLFFFNYFSLRFANFSKMGTYFIF